VDAGEDLGRRLLVDDVEPAVGSRNALCAVSISMPTWSDAKP